MIPYFYTRAFNSKYRKRYRKFKKGVATITKTSDFQRHTTGHVAEEIKGPRGAYTFHKAEYEFYIDGNRYVGIGEVYFLSLLMNKQNVKIWYNPDNPGENCTNYVRNHKLGRHLLLGYAVFFGFLALIVLIFRGRV